MCLYSGRRLPLETTLSIDGFCSVQKESNFLFRCVPQCLQTSIKLKFSYSQSISSSSMASVTLYLKITSCVHWKNLRKAVKNSPLCCALLEKLESSLNDVSCVRLISYKTHKPDSKLMHMNQLSIWLKGLYTKLRRQEMLRWKCVHWP
jgi:hypothetical protein